MNKFENMPAPIQKNELDILIDKKVSFIKQKLDIQYSQEEKDSFDLWLSKIPNNSSENPLTITNTEEITKLLPKNPNYTGEKVNLFFTKEEFSINDLHEILENFARQNPIFEISIVKHSDTLISIGIGNKLSNCSSLKMGENEFGHYHPNQFNFANKEILPDCFVAGLMPSSGDIKGFLKYPKLIEKGTRIYSKNGYILIQPDFNNQKDEDNINDYKLKYFDLFFGENNLGFKTDEEASKYFKEKIGLQIEFHYFDNKKNN